MARKSRSTQTPQTPLVLGHDIIAKPQTMRMDGVRAAGLEASRRRISFTTVVLAGLFFIVGARLVELAIRGSGDDAQVASSSVNEIIHRPDIVDRNGEVMATDIVTASLFVDARYVIDPEKAAHELVGVLPDLNEADVARKFASGRPFVWLKRDLTPKQQYAVHYLGIPGLQFQREQKRVYPNGAAASMILGMVDIDNKGIAGIERYVDQSGMLLNRPNDLTATSVSTGGTGDGASSGIRDNGALMLSIDVRVQYALRDELQKGFEEFKAKAAGGMVMDIYTGEVLGMVSLPDFDPNNPNMSDENAHFNRMTLGVYEMGSVMKTFTFAGALDSGAVKINNSFDATHALKVSRFTISDFHPERRWLTVPEIYMYSSNIGTAKMALAMGRQEHQAYLRKMGLLSRPRSELPEEGDPLVPANWTDLSTMTISFGHGLSVAPIQVVQAACAVVNGGFRIQPTFLRRSGSALGERILSAQTSQEMRELMRLVVTNGTGKKADVPGYPVMGKTGTAEKAGKGGYAKKKLLTSFLSAFPANDPRYVLLIMFDEPNPTPKTYGYATAGWNAAPVTGKVIQRIAPLLGVRPVNEMSANPLIEAKLVVGAGGD